MDSKIRLKLGRKLKQLRRDAGYTQEKLAELAKIDYKYLQRVEGKRPPNMKLETLERIAKALKISVSTLLKF